LLRRSADNLLALFTSREVAESIVGDLLEQRQAHRRGWFACEVARIALALCCTDLAAAPWRTCRLAALGWAVYAGSSVLLFVASGLPWYPWHLVNQPGFWLRLGLVLFAANLLTGGILARWPPRSGSAIAPLIALWLAGWLLSPLWITLADDRFAWPGADVPGRVASTVLVPLLYLVPLLLGAFFGQWRHKMAATRTH
jgi:hypothetical protein